MKMCLMSIWIGTLFNHFLKGAIPHFVLIPLPLFYTISLFWSISLPYNRETYVLNEPLEFCIIMLFDFLSFEVSTLRDEIFADIGFRKYFFRILCRNKFSLFGIYQGFRGSNFRSHDVYKDFAGIKFHSCLKEQFIPRPYFVCWEIDTLLIERNNGHEKT